jgi:GNAT superfamily N-acetyltransferase
MTPQDIPLGMRLSRESSWNQTPADWRRFIELEPEGCFVAELQGRPVGTTCTLVLGSAACVALVLVDAAWRRRGIGTTLVQAAVGRLDRHRVKSIRLDATPAGEPLYARFGFAPDYEIVRFEGTLPLAAFPSAPFAAGAPAAPCTPGDLEEVIALDRAITGMDRGRVLTRLFGEHPDRWRIVRQGGRIVGYAATRPGGRGVHLGPCAALGRTGPALLVDACRRHAGERVILDIPAANAQAMQAAHAAGLAEQRRLVRMCRGERVRDDALSYWATSGPEKG